MAILASDIPAGFSVALPERIAETLPISPNPPIKDGKIAKKYIRLFSLLSLSLCGKNAFEAAEWRKCQRWHQPSDPRHLRQLSGHERANRRAKMTIQRH